MNVREERTGWRDLSLSQRHRKFGFNCPAVDVDHFIEFDNGKAAGIIEYKAEQAQPQDLTSYTYQAFVDIANRAQLPAFSVRYVQKPSWWYRVIPMNPYAFVYVEFDVVDMDEVNYVSLLYRIRGRVAPRHILATLDQTPLPATRPPTIDLWKDRKVQTRMWEGRVMSYPPKRAA